MSWTYPFILAGICSLTVLTYLYFYLYFQYRERYVLLWAGSWLICLLGLVFAILVFIGMSPALVIGHQVFSVLSGVILLWGTHVFLKKTMPGHWVFGCMLVAAWAVGGVLPGLPLLWRITPIFLFLGAVYIRAGLLFLAHREIRGTGRRLTGLALVAWGMHKFDYPFLQAVDWFTPWGYLIALILALTVAIGFLLVYFHKIRTNLAESEKRFRLLAENARDIIYRYRTEPQRGFDYISPSVSNILGYTPEELYSDPELYRNMIHPDDHDLIGNIIHPDFSQPDIFRLIRRDGKVIWTEQRAVPIYGRDGTITAVEGIVRDISGRREVENAIRSSEERYRLVVENAREAIFVIQDGGIKFANRKTQELAGCTGGDPLPEDFLEYVSADDRQMAADRYRRRISGQELPDTYFFKLITREGSVRHVEINAVTIVWEGRPATLNFMSDITRRRLAEERLQESELALKRKVDYQNMLMGNINEVFLTYDMEGRITFCNKKSFEVLGYTPAELVGLTLFHLADQDQQEIVLDIMKKRLEKGEPGSYEISIRHKSGSRRIIKVNSSPIVEDGKITGGMVLAEDITGRKRAEEQLKYLSLHDSLTGLYNRAYFEQEMRRLEAGRQSPVGLIMCDVDGLKLANDTLGHGFGDSVLAAAAGVIRESFREGDMVARIGGDEFAVLLPGANKNATESAGQRIRESIRRYNLETPSLPLSISIGLAISEGNPVHMNTLFKEADNAMYREKLHRKQSARSAIVQTLMKALEARDFITEGHADRLQELVEDLARTIGLAERNISDLRLLARFHDIGKVGIPDRILFKPGRLTSGEKAEMQRHCEIGHRIAQSAPDLSHIADWILKHHEWWNGRGYPLGLGGEAIPIECRILAIADAYDSMTNDRPYRKALSDKEAAAELKRCAGTQFDPDMVQVFLEVLEQNRRTGS